MYQERSLIMSTTADMSRAIKTRGKTLLEIDVLHPEENTLNRPTRETCQMIKGQVSTGIKKFFENYYDRRKHRNVLAAWRE